MHSNGTGKARGADAAASPPAEQLLDVGELQLDIGRAAMVALAGMRRRLHLAEQRVHLIDREAAAGADRAVTGHRAADLFQLLLEAEGVAELGELVGEVADQPLRSVEHTPELQSLMRSSY